MKRNPALTKDCKPIVFDPKVHKSPRQRDPLLVEAVKSIAECTARMRQLRK